MASAGSTQSPTFIQRIFGTSHVDHILNLVIVIFISIFVFLFIVMPIARLVLEYLAHRRLKGRKLTFLELTPPALSTKTPYATEQLDVSLHGMLSRQTLLGRLLHHRQVVSLEIVQSWDGGIRFITAVDPKHTEMYQQLVHAHLPSARIREVPDYMSSLEGDLQIQAESFKQIGSFGFALADQAKLPEHDPIAFLTSALGRAQPGELTALQITLTPAPLRAVTKLQAKLIAGQDPGMRRLWWHWPFIILWKLVGVFFSILKFMLEMIADELSGTRTTYESRLKYQEQYAKQVHPYTKHKLPAVQAKLDQPLFGAEVRVIAIGQDAAARVNAVGNALYQFHVPGYQGFTTRRRLPFRKQQQFLARVNSYLGRLPTRFTMNTNILSTGELASLYHFPYGLTAQPENLSKSLSNDLPAPLVMKQRATADEYAITLGMNHYHGSNTLVGLTESERLKHLYVVGGTGNGKTTMLTYAMVQDIRAGRGMAFIDPHGDAAQELLKHIPKSRLDDVIYLNPMDIKYPIGLNLLELPEGLDEDDLLLEKERVTEAAVSVLRKVFSDDSASAVRIEGMLRNAILTAFTVPDATLFTVLKLLRNSEFRKSVVDTLEDDDLKDFWREEFGQAGGMQRVSMTKGLTNRLDRFRASAPVFRMLSQVHSTISFEDLMNDGKILICNFSTEMGEDTSVLFGTTVLAKLKITAERRAVISEKDRRPFYVYVDEFQNFATTPFVKMLSASRKFGLFLTMAEQSTSQQDEQRLTEGILSNVGTLVCFRTGSPADTRELIEWFTPQLERSDIGNLPAHHFYIRVRSDQPMEPVSGETLLLENEGSDDVAEKVKARSRELYGRMYVKPEKKVEAEPTATKKPTKVAMKKSMKVSKKN